MAKSATWQHRVADSDEERFGLLDPPTMGKYRKQPVLQEPEGDLPSMREFTAFGITSGIGSMLTGADQLGYKVVGNIEWRDYYRYRNGRGQSTFPQRFPGAFMARGINDVPKNMLPGSIDFAAGHPESFHPSVPVYTSQGWRPIGEVKVGDLVLTHKGRFRKVYRAYHYECPADTEEVTLSRNSRVSGASLVTTMNHPVLMKDGSWKAAGDVRKGDEVVHLAQRCGTCKDLRPTIGACGCKNRQQWANLTEQERRDQVSAANTTTRERAACGEHHFGDPGIRRKGQLVQGRSSVLENSLFDLLKGRGFNPERQFPVEDYFVDVAIPEHKIAIEVDGGNWHLTIRKQDQDRRKAEVLSREGWTLVRTSPRPDRWQGGELQLAVDEVCRIAANHGGEYEFASFKVVSLRRRAMEVGEPLCNLSVEEDETYIANGWVVHNCGRYSSLSHSVALGNYQESRGSDVSDIPMFLRLVAELEPRFFLMDDLPASFGPFPMSEYVNLLPGYDLYPEWISNWGYGNIQKHRNRMFIVGAKKSESFVFVPGEAEHHLVLKDVIGDLLPFGPGELPNHAYVDPDYVPGRYVNMRSYGDRASWGELQELFKTGEWGINLKYYSPAGEQKIRPGTTNPKWDGFCPVLSGGYNPIHPIRRQPLTIRERARIQGFPDDFLFYHDEEGPDREVWEPYCSDGQRGIKQTGKAMPLQFCTYVADQVRHHMEGKPFEATGARVIKPNAMVTQAKEDFCRLSGYADQEGACRNCWHRPNCPLFLELKN